jgi:hypothetical protein
VVHTFIEDLLQHGAPYPDMLMCSGHHAHIYTAEHMGILTSDPKMIGGDCPHGVEDILQYNIHPFVSHLFWTDISLITLTTGRLLSTERRQYATAYPVRYCLPHAHQAWQRRALGWTLDVDHVTHSEMSLPLLLGADPVQ